MNPPSRVSETASRPLGLDHGAPPDRGLPQGLVQCCPHPVYPVALIYCLCGTCAILKCRLAVSWSQLSGSGVITVKHQLPGTRAPEARTQSCSLCTHGIDLGTPEDTSPCSLTTSLAFTRMSTQGKLRQLSTHFRPQPHLLDPSWTLPVHRCLPEYPWDTQVLA